jgi:tetratricopeptide (TPR) repeat protein
MRASLTSLTAVVAALAVAAPALAQYREYYVRGRVVDPQKAPIPGVEIHFRDVETSRSYSMTTDKDGLFKLAGLPHGKYEVSFSKEGYVAAKDEWSFEAKQERMQKVDVPDVVLVSQALSQKAMQLKEADSAVKEAGERLRTGDFDGASALLQGVLAKNPKDANALFYLGLSYAGKKMCREAIPPLTRVTELSPAFPGAWFQLGVCHRQLGDTEKALAFFEKSLELEPADTNSAYDAGLILFETNRIDEALARFEKGLAAKPEDPDLLEMTGRCYIHQGKFDTAVARLEKAREGTTDPGKQAFLDQLISGARAMVK